MKMDKDVMIIMIRRVMLKMRIYNDCCQVRIMITVMTMLLTNIIIRKTPIERMTIKDIFPGRVEQALVPTKLRTVKQRVQSVSCLSKKFGIKFLGRLSKTF